MSYLVEQYEDVVHEVAQIIADETEHYTQFHRGLHSVSATKIREAAKKVVEYMRNEPSSECIYKVGDRIVVVMDCNAYGERIYMNDGKEFTITKIETPMERFGNVFNFDYVLTCDDSEWFRDCDVNLVVSPETETVVHQKKDSDTTYLFFKESGKWKYEGRGWFPKTWEVDRETIMAANGGRMPGIMSEGADYVIVVIPDEDSEAEFAYPRMIKPTR
jgi:hypothetical protein